MLKVNKYQKPQRSLQKGKCSGNLLRYDNHAHNTTHTQARARAHVVFRISFRGNAHRFPYSALTPISILQYYNTYIQNTLWLMGQSISRRQRLLHKESQKSLYTYFVSQKSTCALQARMTLTSKRHGCVEYLAFDPEVTISKCV